MESRFSTIYVRYSTISGFQCQVLRATAPTLVVMRSVHFPALTAFIHVVWDQSVAPGAGSVRQLGLTLRWPSSCQPRPGFPALLTLSLVTVALAPPCKPPQGHVSSAGWWGFTAAQPRQGSLYGWGQAQIGLQPSGHGGGGRRYHWGGRGEGRGTVGGGWEELWL